MDSGTYTFTVLPQGSINALDLNENKVFRNLDYLHISKMATLGHCTDATVLTGSDVQEVESTRVALVTTVMSDGGRETL